MFGKIKRGCTCGCLCMYMWMFVHVHVDVCGCLLLLCVDVVSCVVGKNPNYCEQKTVIENRNYAEVIMRIQDAHTRRI